MTANPGFLTIIEPKLYVNSTIPFGDPGVANMADPDPKVVYQTGSTAARDFVLDFGTTVTLDCMFVGYHTAPVGAQFRVATASNSAGSGQVNVALNVPMRPADCKTTRANAVATFTPTASRYWVFALYGGYNMQIGIVAAGLGFQAEWDRDWGGGREPIDTGVATPVMGGGFGIVKGARKLAYHWTFGELTDVEIELLTGIFLRVGTTDPVVVAERLGTIQGSSEQIHYGLFRRLDKFERRDPNATKWAVSIEEWS